MLRYVEHIRTRTCPDMKLTLDVPNPVKNNVNSLIGNWLAEEDEIKRFEDDFCIENTYK